MDKHNTKEEFKVTGHDILKKVKELIHEGDIRRIIIKNEKGHTILEIPLTYGAIATILVPALAAVGALTALVTKCTIIVERNN